MMASFSTNDYRKRCSALQGRMQCTAGAVAVHCGGGCSALRGRLQCTASEMGETGSEVASPILDSYCPLNFLERRIKLRG